MASLIHQSQVEKASHFRQLHHAGKMLVFPNIWDTLSALLVENLHYPAIATASASIAFSNGYHDGEKIPFQELLNTLTKICSSVSIPVTADIESGYAANDRQLRNNIHELIATGIVGINIEDSDKQNNTLYSIETQCNRIHTIKQAASECGIPLFINARTDVYLHGSTFTTTEAKLNETIIRGLAYKEAGADCIFPIAIRQEEEIKKLIAQLQIPINILALPGIPELNILEKIGVTRVSLGPAFLKIAIQAMKNIAVKLNSYEGLSDITENEITTDYLKTLVNTQI